MTTESLLISECGYRRKYAQEWLQQKLCAILGALNPLGLGKNGVYLSMHPV